MVKINLPPPLSADPLFEELAIGFRLMRIFDPTRYGTAALTFRYHGRISRFDHHKQQITSDQTAYYPAYTQYHQKANLKYDPERGILYAAYSLEGCLVEVFGDTAQIEIKEQQVAFIQLVRPLMLLNLRGSGAMRAGSVSALAMTSDRPISQAWSSYFYETYPNIDGILYANAHNGMEAIALYERAKDALQCQQIFPLSDYRLRPHIQQAALKNHLQLNIFG